MLASLQARAARRARSLVAVCRRLADRSTSKSAGAPTQLRPARGARGAGGHPREAASWKLQVASCKLKSRSHEQEAEALRGHARPSGAPNAFGGHKGCQRLCGACWAGHQQLARPEGGAWKLASRKSSPRAAGVISTSLSLRFTCRACLRARWASNCCFASDQLAQTWRLRKRQAGPTRPGPARMATSDNRPSAAECGCLACSRRDSLLKRERRARARRPGVRWAGRSFAQWRGSSRPPSPRHFRSAHLSF